MGSCTRISSETILRGMVDAVWHLGRRVQRACMRSLSDQTVEELGGRWSILTRQKQDHVQLDRMLESLRSTGGEEREELLNRIYRLVFSHAFAEEAVLWPALRRALHDGEELTTRVEREHQE